MEISIELPSYVITALQQLESGGYSAYAVGGCIRDALLCRIPNDWDITTNALPEQTERCFAEYSVYRTGIKHGTVTVLIENHPLEITTFRIDGSYSDCRRPDSVEFTSSLREDLRRRDFTVNAMAYQPQAGKKKGLLQDYFGGQEDLKNRIVRCVGEPARRFREDALRILRGIRFAAVLDFQIEPETAHAIHENAPLLRKIAWERIRVEWEKMLCSRAPQQWIREYADVHAVIFPELFIEKNAEAICRLDCFEGVEKDIVLRWAILFCLFGQKEQAEAVFHRLRYDTKTITALNLLLRHTEDALSAEPTALCEKLSELGEDGLRRLVHLQQALSKTPSEKERLIAVEKERKSLLEKRPCYSLAQLKISGQDLISLGYTKGKTLGTELKNLLSAVIKGEIDNEPAILRRQAELDLHSLRRVNK